MRQRQNTARAAVLGQSAQGPKPTAFLIALLLGALAIPILGLMLILGG